WNAGTVHNITWNEDAVATVRLEYSSDNGSNWQLIADNIAASSSPYPWTVPVVSTTQGRIRVSSVTMPPATSMNTNPFEISISGTAIQVATGWNIVSNPLA